MKRNRVSPLIAGFSFIMVVSSALEMPRAEKVSLNIECNRTICGPLDPEKCPKSNRRKCDLKGYSECIEGCRKIEVAYQNYNKYLNNPPLTHDHRHGAGDSPDSSTR